MYSFKQYITYTMLFSFLWSNIARAGKEFLDQQADSPKPLVSIKPHTLSSSRDIDSLHLFESGEIVAEDVQGTRTLIPKYQQPREIKEAIQGGYIANLLNHFNLYIRQSGEDYKLQLMGGLKGGMMGGFGSGGGGFDSLPVCRGSNDTDCREPGGGFRITVTPFNSTTGSNIPSSSGNEGFSSSGGSHSNSGGFVGGSGRYHVSYGNLTYYYDSNLHQDDTHGRAREWHTMRDWLEGEYHKREAEKQKQEHEQKIERHNLAISRLEGITNDITKTYPESRLCNIHKEHANEEFFQLWKSKQGTSFPSMEAHVYGYNYRNNPSLVNTQNGLSYPIFIDDRTADYTGLFLPQGYNLSVADKGIGDFAINRYGKELVHLMDHIIGVSCDAHNPVRLSFVLEKSDGNLPYTVGLSFDTAYKNLTLIRKSYPPLRESGELAKQKLGNMLMDLDGCLYNAYSPQPSRWGGLMSRSDVPSHLMEGVLNTKSFIGRNENHTINNDSNALRPAVKNIHGDIAMEDPFLQNGLVYGLFKDDMLKEGAFLPHGYQDIGQQDERLGEALLKGIGTGIKGLWCGTIGVCDANANKLVLDVIKFGPHIINLADKAWKWTAITLGVGAKTLLEKDALPTGYQPHVKGLHDMVLQTPNNEKLETRMKILETWGVEQSLKIFSTPQSEELATKLVTGTYEGVDTSILTQDIPIREDKAQHIFKDDEGHFKEDTPDNRKQLIDTAKPEHFSHTDEYGKDIYARNLENGKQIWLHVRNKEIRNGGINDIPRDPLYI